MAFHPYLIKKLLVQEDNRQVSMPVLLLKTTGPSCTQVTGGPNTNLLSPIPKGRFVITRLRFLLRQLQKKYTVTPKFICITLQ